MLSCDKNGVGLNFSRFLTHPERFLLQGHEASVFTPFSDDEPMALEVFSNTYQPVSVAAVWAPLICSAHAADEGCFSPNSESRIGGIAPASKGATRWSLPPVKNKSKPKGKAKSQPKAKGKSKTRSKAAAMKA